MRIYRHLLPVTQPIALTIGNFDGVHRGHQAMLDRLKQVANQRGLLACAMTFEPHPRELLTPAQAPARLTSLREKLALMAASGLDQVQICQFNPSFAKMEAEQFVRQILLQTLNIRWLLVGDDFRFGARRKGDTALLQHMLTDSKQAELAIMPPILLDGMRISSTSVRQALQSGDLDLATQLLGRPYSISGRVVHGEKLGKQIGFPTANIQLKHTPPPLSGIFVVEARRASNTAGTETIRGVASLGVRPTVAEHGRPILEVYLLDFDEEIYGQQLQIDFLKKLRDEEKFPDMNTMIRQIERDVAQSRDWFSRIDAASHATACLNI